MLSLSPPSRHPSCPCPSSHPHLLSLRLRLAFPLAPPHSFSLICIYPIFPSYLLHSFAPSWLSYPLLAVLISSSCLFLCLHSFVILSVPSFASILFLLPISSCTSFSVFQSPISFLPCVYAFLSSFSSIPFHFFVLLLFPSLLVRLFYLPFLSRSLSSPSSSPFSSLSSPPLFPAASSCL